MTAPPEPRAVCIVVGISEYDYHPDLPGVRADAERMAILLDDLGFERRHAQLGSDSTAEDLRRALDEWTREPDVDKAVIYWAGHGVWQQRGNSFALLTKSSPLHGWSPVNSIKGGEIADFLANSSVKELLLIIDTCYAGGGSTDIATQLWQALDVRNDSDSSDSRVWVLAASRALQAAQDTPEGGLLARALDRLIRQGPSAELTWTWTERDEFIRIDDIYRALADEFEVLPSAQQPELKGSNPLGERFLRNLAYRPEAPAETVLDARARRARAGAALDSDEAETHFWPRSRGIEADEIGWHFVGRAAPLRSLVRWLDEGVGLHLLTGRPGSGKSAVVGRLATLSDPKYRSVADREGVLEKAPSGTVPAEWSIGVAVRLTGKTLEDCLIRIARAYDIELAAQRRPTRALIIDELDRRVGPAGATIVLDALDEAATPSEIAEFVRQLARSQRVLVASRGSWGRVAPESSPDMGPLLRILDASPDQVTNLDADPDAEADITGYAFGRLTDPRSDSPYQSDPVLARQAAEHIGLAASGVFRLAADWCRLLIDEPEALAPDSQTFRTLLRQGSEGVFRRELTRLGPDESKGRELLSALALTEGIGMPRHGVWPAVACALARLPTGSGKVYELRDVVWVLAQAGHLITQDGQSGRTVYRLYHQEFASYLRVLAVPGDESVVQRAIATELAELSREAAWRNLPDYIVQHLATHAAAGGELDQLVTEPGFLAMADPGRLVRVLHTVHSPSGKRNARLYLQAAHRLRGCLPEDRLAILDLVSRQNGGPGLDVDPSACRWRIQWCSWRPSHELLTMEGHSAGVESITFGDLGGQPVLVTTSHDGTARIWDARTGEHIQVLEGHGDWVMGAAIGKVGDRPVIATAGANGNGRIWDVVGGRTTQILRGHEDRMVDIALCQLDSESLAISAGWDGTVRVWNASTGEQTRVLADHDGRVLRLAFSLIDNRPVAATAGEDGSVRLWDLRTSELMQVFEGNGYLVNAVAVGYLAGRAVVVAGGADRQARVWDVETGSVLSVLVGHDDRILAAALGEADGDPIVVTAGDDGTTRLWDGDTGAGKMAFEGRGGSVVSVTMCEIDGHTSVATANADGSAQMWDVRIGEPLQESVANQGHVRDVAYLRTDSAEMLATAGDDGSVWIRATDGTVLRKLPGHEATVWGVTLGVVDECVIAATVSSDCSVKLWDVATGELLATLMGHRDIVKRVAFGQTERLSVLATASADGTARIWDLRSKEELRAINDHGSGVWDVSLCVVGHRLLLATAGGDGCAFLWDVNTGDRIRTLEAHSGQVLSVQLGHLGERAVALTGRAFGTAHPSGSCRLWDVHTGEALLTAENDADWVRTATLGRIGDRPVVAMAGDDGVVHIRDAGDGRELHAIPLASPVNAIVPGPGSTFAVACGQGVAMLGCESG